MSVHELKPYVHFRGRFSTRFWARILLCCVLVNVFYVYKILHQRSEHSKYWIQIEPVDEIELRNHTRNVCQFPPKKNVVFLKTHKCASTSIQNMFIRYGYKHKLKFVLPAKHNYLGHPALFHRSLVPKGHYNMLTHHTRFNYPEMKLLMPEDTVYVTILRHPVQLFESMYQYYRLDKFYQFPFDQFQNESATLPDFKSRFGNRIGPNQMLFDLGYSIHNSSQQVIRAYISQIESHFDLIMIEEHFDESVILLKNLLCWNTDDVITFKMNARVQSQPVDRLTRRRIEQLNSSDMILYEYFLNKFKDQLHKYGQERLRTEVDYLNKRRTLWFDYCVDKDTQTGNHSKVIFFQNRHLDCIDCTILTSKELQLTEFLRKRQLHLYPKSVFVNKFFF